MVRLLSTSRPKKRRPRLRNIEAGLWSDLKTSLPKIGRPVELTRIESHSTPGIPDVLCCNENGVFSFIELKVLHGTSKKVALSPHQVSWQVRHSHSRTFVVIRPPDLSLHVHLGSSSVDLCMDGLTSVPALQVFESPIDYEEFWELTCSAQWV